MTRSRRRRRSRRACPCLPRGRSERGRRHLGVLPPRRPPARACRRSRDDRPDLRHCPREPQSDRSPPRSRHGTANCCCTTRRSGRVTSAATSRSPSTSRGARPGALAVRRRRLRQRARTWPHVILAAMAAQGIGRPVKIVLTRRQMYYGVGHRLHHPARGARRRARRPPGCDHPRRHRRDLLLRVHRAAARRRGCSTVATTSRRCIGWSGSINTPTPMRAPGHVSGLRPGMRDGRARGRARHRPGRAAIAQPRRRRSGRRSAVVEQVAERVPARRRRALRLGSAHPEPRSMQTDGTGRLWHGGDHLSGTADAGIRERAHPARRQRDRAQRLQRHDPAPTPR